MEAPIADVISIETECGVTFKSPDPKEGKLTHRHLGYMMDSKLSGSSHTAKMHSVYNSQLPKVEAIYKKMGETMALWYLSTTAGPKVMYGSEIIRY